MYASVDDAVRRRKRKRGADDEAEGPSSRMGESAKRSRATGAISIAEQHANAKQSLSSMSMADWESIPEESGARARNREDRGSQKESFVPVPDSILLQGAGIAAQPPGQPSSAQEAPDGVPLGGSASSSAAASGAASDTTTGLASTMSTTPSSITLNNARAKRLESTLAAAGAQVGGQSVLDPAGYASQLQTSMTRAAASGSVTDVDQTREVLRSLVATNSSQPMAWITAARFEASVGKTTAARKLILDGTKACPSSEDVWVEAATLLPPDQAQGILAEAVRNVPNSVKIWLTASELENTDAGKKAVLRAAIESIPGSV